jgi:CarD family transcriptional regulator
MFQVNDKVIYPGHGVAIIKELLEKNVSNSKALFFKLSFPYKDMTVLVPQHRLEAAGIRELSNKTEITQALRELSQLPKLSTNGEVAPAGWSRRHREYQLKIQRGRLVDVASIYRDLMYTSIRKELSFGEKSLMQTTEELLVQEIFTAQDCNEDEAIDLVRGPFKIKEKTNQQEKQTSSGA